METEVTIYEHRSFFLILLDGSHAHACNVELDISTLSVNVWAYLEAFLRISVLHKKVETLTESTVLMSNIAYVRDPSNNIQKRTLVTEEDHAGTEAVRPILK